MNEIIFYKVDRDNLCETDYFDAIARNLNQVLSNFSIIFTADWNELPETKYEKIVILGGDEQGHAGLRPYSQYKDVVAVFRIYNVEGRYNNKYVFPIPCGYNCRSNGQIMTQMYPNKKISEREYDIFYSGQILNNRKELVKQLDKLKQSFNIFSQTNPSFRTGLPIDEYYQLLGDSKICVCPDGTTVDTFRFVEACGSRCIIITTPKDNLWYYKDVPGFYIDDWSKLTKSYIDMILNRNLDTYQDDMEVYYGDNLSAWGVAHHIVKELYNAV